MIYTVPRDVNNASGMLQYQSTVVDDTSQTVQFTFSFSIYICLILCVFLCQQVQQTLHLNDYFVNSVTCYGDVIIVRAVICTQVSGLETDLAKLWQAVESLGGLQQVIDKHRWNKVVEMLKIPKIVSFV